ncbi:MAG: SOS response-associated peptidase [Myxococcota bacterium]
MCGRYTLKVSPEDVYEELAFLERPDDALADLLAFGDAELARSFLRPRFNVAPTQPVPIVREKKGEVTLRMHTWGLVPFWAKEKDLKARGSRINARVETVDTKPAFRQAYRKRRCLVLADGWIEWRREGKARLPFLHTVPESGLLTFAGLWARWNPPEEDAKPVYSCSILTREAEGTPALVHDRMPVIVPAEERRAWIDGTRDVTKDDPRVAVMSAPLPEVVVRPISPAVNKWQNDDPSVLEPGEHAL